MFSLITKKASTRNSTSQVKRGIVSSARDPLPSLPQMQGLPKEVPSKINKSVLAGGVKVLSVDTPSPITTLSLFVNAGTRFETRQTMHATSFLKYLVFKGTAQKSAIRLFRDLEYIGASLEAEITRDNMIYHVRGLRFPEVSADVSLDIMAESLRYVLSPLLLEHELANARPIIHREIESNEKNPKFKVLDLLHSEAFRDSGLGQLLYPTSAVDNITPQHLHTHVKQTYYPGDRMMIVATGIQHDHLISKLTPLFSNPVLQGAYHELRDLPPLPSEPLLPQNAKFHGGGTVRILSSDQTNVAIGYPGVATSNKDYIILSILAEILGGSRANGKSSKLFQNVVDKNSWVEYADVFNFGYADTGLFGIAASAAPGHGKNLVGALTEVVNSVAKSISAEDVTRGQRLVRNRFLSDAASDRFTFASHIFATGTTPTEYLNSVQAVKLEDVQRVAKSVLSAKPVLAAVGDVREVAL